MRSPQEIVQYVNQSALHKEHTPLRKVVVLGILGGIYIAIGALLSIIIGYGFPGVAASNPAITKLFMGATFPIGLILIVLAGGELFTGCCAYFVPNILSGRQKLCFMAKYCTIIWFANFVGALLFGYLFVHLTHISHYQSTLDGFLAVAQSKTSNPIYVTILKGVGANMLVCLAMWLGISSKSVAGKILGIWFPVMTFVAIGYEHSIANMLFLPVAMLEGFDLSICDMFTNNLIPATLGNIIGGAIFVGAAYWYLYDRGE